MDALHFSNFYPTVRRIMSVPYFRTRKNQDFAECQLFARANFLFRILFRIFFYSAFYSAFFFIPRFIPHFFFFPHFIPQFRILFRIFFLFRILFRIAEKMLNCRENAELPRKC